MKYLNAIFIRCPWKNNTKQRQCWLFSYVVDVMHLFYCILVLRTHCFKSKVLNWLTADSEKLMRSILAVKMSVTNNNPSHPNNQNPPRYKDHYYNSRVWRQEQWHKKFKHFLFSFSYCNHHLQTFSSSLWFVCPFVWSLDICILSNKSFILECKESFQLSSLSKQEFSWSNSWSRASYSARENK